MSEFNSEWIRLVYGLKWCLDNYDPVAFTMQADNSLFEFGPYVQAQYLEDTIEIEVTSNKYLRPGLSEFMIQRMEFLGWNLPDDEDHPNFWISIPNTEEWREWAAKLWVRTLDLVFQIPRNTHFELAPFMPSAHWEVGKYLFHSRLPMHFTLFKTQLAQVLSDAQSQTSGNETNGDEHVQTADSNAERPANPGDNSLSPELENAVSFAAYRVLSRGLDLGLQGTELIELAETMGSKLVVNRVRELVYGTRPRKKIGFTDEQLAKLSIHPCE